MYREQNFFTNPKKTKKEVSTAKKKKTNTHTDHKFRNKLLKNRPIFVRRHTHTLIGSFDAKAKTNFVVDARSIFYSRQER